jgi:cytoskeleton protein RodZ
MADIGSTLREARMRARIDISEVEARTKIRAKYLRAIENEEWDLLPGPVYVKSFLKTYADYLGLDSRLLVDEFKRRYERPTDHELRPMSSLTRERERAARRPGRGFHVPSWLIIGLVLVVVVVVLYVIGSGSTQNKPNPGSARATGHARHQASHPATTPVVTKPPAPTSATLKLVPTGSVYVCVEDRHGHKLIPGVIYSVGQTIPVQTGRELLVTLGNDAVSLKVNGKAYPVAASSTAIGLKVTAAGVRPLPAAQAPTCA